MNLTTKPPAYPRSRFPSAIGEPIDEVLQNTQAPDALVTMEFISCMSAVAQGLYDVRLPTGQIRPTSTNVLIVAASGERKTGVHEAVSKPIYAFDCARLIKYEDDFKAYKAKMSVWKSVYSGLRRQIAKLTQDGQPIDELCSRIVQHEADKPIQPRLRRIMRQNATDRAIIDALEGDGESIAFISDEGEIITKGGALNQTGVLNKGWDGALMLTIDRSDGVTIVVRRPRVTVAYMVQQEVLKELLDRRGNVMRGSGHWARYLIGCPASTQGSRYTYQLEKEWRYLPKFHERVNELLEEFGRRLDSGTIERTILEFSDDAAARWMEAINNVEAMLNPMRYLHDIKDFGSKVVEISGRVAALLHVFSRQEGKISLDTLNRAIDIVHWHLEEFKRIFSPQLTVPQEQIDAQRLSIT